MKNTTTFREIKNSNTMLKSAFKVLRKKGYAVSVTPVGGSTKKCVELCNQTKHVFVNRPQNFGWRTSYLVEDKFTISLSWANEEMNPAVIIEAIKASGLEVSWEGGKWDCIYVTTCERVSNDLVKAEYELEETFRQMEVQDYRIKEAQKRKAELTEKYIQLGREIEALKN